MNARSRKPKPLAPAKIWIVYEPVDDPYECDYTVYTDEERALQHLHNVAGTTLFVGTAA